MNSIFVKSLLKEEQLFISLDNPGTAPYSMCSCPTQGDPTHPLLHILSHNVMPLLWTVLLKWAGVYVAEDFWVPDMDLCSQFLHQLGSIHSFWARGWWRRWYCIWCAAGSWKYGSETQKGGSSWRIAVNRVIAGVTEIMRLYPKDYREIREEWRALRHSF